MGKEDEIALADDNLEASQGVGNTMLQHSVQSIELTPLIST